jgi:hypothetical protein
MTTPDWRSSAMDQAAVTAPERLCGCTCGCQIGPNVPGVCVWCVEAGHHPGDVTFRERLDALPCEGATRSRDYGRGYAQAIRDVQRLMHAHDRQWLEETCCCDPVTVDMQNHRTPLPATGREQA